jgi:hypothetical protein
MLSPGKRAPPHPTLRVDLSPAAGGGVIRKVAVVNSPLAKKTTRTTGAFRAAEESFIFPRIPQIYGL